MSTPDTTAELRDDDAPQLYLFAFCIDPDVTAPELLTLFVFGDTDRPLMLEDRILFFTRPPLGDRALEQAGLREQFPGPAPTDVSLTCDVAAALYLIAHADEDAHAIVLNCVNTLLDMIAATRFAVPPEHERVLHALADHMTFGRDVAGFFAEQQLPRIAAQDALLWAIGAITARARVIG